MRKLALVIMACQPTVSFAVLTVLGKKEWGIKPVMSVPGGTLVDMMGTIYTTEALEVRQVLGSKVPVSKPFPVDPLEVLTGV